MIEVFKGMSFIGSLVKIIRQYPKESVKELYRMLLGKGKRKGRKPL